MSDKYEGIYPLTLLLALAAAVRTLRCSHVIPLLANGQTRTVLWGSVARCTGLTVAITCAIFVHDLLWIAAAAVFGEVFAAVVSIAVIRRSASIPDCTVSRELLPFVACVTLLAATHYCFDRNLPIPVISATLFAGMACIMVWRSFILLKQE